MSVCSMSLPTSNASVSDFDPRATRSSYSFCSAGLTNFSGGRVGCRVSNPIPAEQDRDRVGMTLFAPAMLLNVAVPHFCASVV